MFTLKEEDPRRRNNFSFGLDAERNLGRGDTRWRRKAKRNCRPLAAKRPAAAMFVFLVPSTVLHVRPSEQR